MTALFYNPDPDKITILLGRKCNLHCQYCSQNNIYRQEELPNVISEVVLNYLQYLHNNCTHPIKVGFYGGEPLLYWDNIKSIIKYCININQTATNAPICNYIVTNGILLNKEIIQFLNDTNTTITISYDGENSKLLRNYNIIEDKKQLLCNVNKLTINGVISKYALPYDICVTLNEFNNLYYNCQHHNIRMNLDVLNPFNSDESLIVNALDMKQSLQLVKQHVNDNIFCRQYINTLICKLKKNYYKLVNNQDNNFCSQGTRELNIDLAGNLYNCHNTTEGYLGNITDTPADIIEKLIKLNYNNLHKNHCKCQNCSAYAICLGGCPNITLESMNDKHCELMHQIAKNILK